MNSFNEDLYHLAMPYVARPDIVQGAGGNCSIKINDEIMLIKASGRTFSDITAAGKGIVPVLYKKLGETILDRSLVSQSEQARLEVVRSLTREAGVERPSMEVWFHVLLMSHVLHTHSVYVNILSCAYEGSDLFRNIMDSMGVDYRILPYVNPGFELGDALHHKIKGGKEVPSVIMLENHGIIISSDSSEKCIALHEEIEQKIKEAVRITTPFEVRSDSRNEQNDFEKFILFPDQVIYPTHEAIHAAHRFILKNIRDNNLTIRTIPNESADALKHMDSEKHRKNIQQTY